MFLSEVTLSAIMFSVFRQWLIQQYKKASCPLTMSWSEISSSCNTPRILVIDFAKLFCGFCSEEKNLTQGCLSWLRQMYIRTRFFRDLLAISSTLNCAFLDIGGTTLSELTKIKQNLCQRRVYAKSNSEYFN